MTWGRAASNAGGARKENIVERGVERRELERLPFFGSMICTRARSNFGDVLRSGGIGVASRHWRHAGHEVDRIEKIWPDDSCHQKEQRIVALRRGQKFAT
jgi:hypothetical protein